MCITARVEPAQLQTIKDMAEALFIHHTRWHFTLNTVVFIIYLTAIITQMFMPNNPKETDFRTGKSAIIIYVMLFISLCANTWLLRSEINSYRGSSHKNFCSYLWKTSTQNLVDLAAIIFAYIYIILRFLIPSQSFLEE